MEITELFMVKVDWDRTYMGTISRFNQDDGIQTIYGKVEINNNVIICLANDEQSIGLKMDLMAKFILDHYSYLNLPVKTLSISSFKINFN